MSVQQTKRKNELELKMRTVEQGGDLFSEDLGLDPRYEVVTMEPLQGYGPIVEAWARMKYPLNVNEDGQHGVIEGEGMRHAIQYPDGSGVYESVAGGTLYAVRTTEETYIWNDDSEVKWPYTARDAQEELDPTEISFPFAFVGAVVTEQTDANLHHPDSIVAMGADGNTVDGEMFMRGVTSADIWTDGEDRGALLEHKDGIQVYIGFDSTSKGRGTFGFVPFDGKEGVRAPSARDAIDLLRPEEAMGDEQRQGEYYFVPMDPLDAKGTIQKPGLGQQPYGASPLDSHVPRDWKTMVRDAEFVRRMAREVGGGGNESPLSYSDSPQDVIEKIGSGEINVPLDRARELAGGIAVRGTVRHRRNDHGMERLDEWHQAVTHDQEVLSIDDAGGTMRFHVDT